MIKELSEACAVGSTKVSSASVRIDLGRADRRALGMASGNHALSSHLGLLSPVGEVFQATRIGYLVPKSWLTSVGR
jgi:hypothetical protein